jgi:hypothetical protein
METARRMSAEQQKASTSNSGDNSQRTMKQNTSKLHIIRLRGLPFSATPADIKSFLAPIELPDGINSIQMVRRPDLRPTGEAYVHLSTETDVMQALNKHKQMMGKRYIEVCRVVNTQLDCQPPKACQRRACNTAVRLSAGKTVAQCLLVAEAPVTLQTQHCLHAATWTLVSSATCLSIMLCRSTCLVPRISSLWCKTFADLC